MEYTEQTLGGSRVFIPDTCIVCKNPWKFGGWHTVHGRTHCAHCGADYQIQPLSDEDWEEVPRCLVKDEFREHVKDFHEKTGESARANPDQFKNYVNENTNKTVV